MQLLGAWLRGGQTTRRPNNAEAAMRTAYWLVPEMERIGMLSDRGAECRRTLFRSEAPARRSCLVAGCVKYQGHPEHSHVCMNAEFCGFCLDGWSK